MNEELFQESCNEVAEAIEMETMESMDDNYKLAMYEYCKRVFEMYEIKLKIKGG